MFCWCLLFLLVLSTKYLFVSESSGIENLQTEGVSEDRIFFTGNIMIDSLISNFEKAKSSEILNQLFLKPHEYATLSMHRPANVDNESTLRKFMREVPLYSFINLIIVLI